MERKLHTDEGMFEISAIDTVDGFVDVFVTGFVTCIVDFLACVKGIQTSTQSMDS